MHFSVVIASLTLLTSSLPWSQSAMWSDQEETSEYWNAVGQEELGTALSRQRVNKNIARNVIFFLGDGMGVTTVTAGRILKGQLMNKSGEETLLAMDKFHHIGLSKTYNVNSQTTDSAASATAYLCGVKTNQAVIGLGGKAQEGVCSTEKGNEVRSVLMDSFDKGKSTGIVTTTRLTHATPCAAYAHSANRDWENDEELPADASDCKDIAQQFFDQSDKITVAFGGGRRNFYPDNVTDQEYPSDNGRRKDGQNLVQKWMDKSGDMNERRKFVWNQTEFDDVDAVSVDRVLGLFEPSHMNYEVDRMMDKAGEPSLREMTRKAIEILRKNSEGYFLLVEGGRIDHGHHATEAHAALRDLVAFDNAVETAVDMTSDQDTLIIVTADHSHTMSLGGYAFRGNSIFGLAPSDGSPGLAKDEKVYTSLLYNNGPGYQNGSSTGGVVQRQDLGNGETAQHREYKSQSAVPRDSETHGGEDVAVFARGPMAHLLRGVNEQSYIAHVMRYASCVGGVTSHCEPVTGTTEATTTVPQIPVAASFLGFELTPSEATIALYVNFVLVICMSVFSIYLGVLAMSKYNKKKLMANTEYRNVTDENHYVQSYKL